MTTPAGKAKRGLYSFARVQQTQRRARACVRRLGGDGAEVSDRLAGQREQYERDVVDEELASTCLRSRA